MWTQLQQAIGVFGWLDTRAPLAVIVGWSIAVAALVLYGLLFSRARWSLLSLMVIAFATPLIIQLPQLDDKGVYWQGRYWLPRLVGLPIVAVGFRSEYRGRVRRPRYRVALAASAALGLTALAAAGQIASFWTALERYRFGVGAPPHRAVNWNPPGGPAPGLALLLAGYALVAGFVVLVWLHRPDRSGRPQSSVARTEVGRRPPERRDSDMPLSPMPGPGAVT
jgi:hypothetical protein